MRSTATAYWGVAIIVVFLISALAAWYFLLQKEQRTIGTEDEARGAGVAPQAFEGAVSSTYENVLSSFMSPPQDKNEREKKQRLTKVGQNPVSGIGFTTSGTSTRLRLVERSTGNILEARPGEAVERLTNTLVSYTFDSIVTRTGRVIMRSIDEDGTILTSVGVVATSSEDAAPLIRRALPSNIRSIVASPDGEEIFYIIEGEGEALGMRAKWDGSGAKQLFSSAIAGWQLDWLPSGRITLTQNASDGIAGYSYSIEKNGAVRTLIRGLPGLTLLAHPIVPALLYGASDAGLALYARTDDAAASVLLPVKTIAEKCVWAPSAELIAYCAVPEGNLASNFLDRWYRGEMHTRDAWWRINVSAGSAELLYSSGAESVDVVRPIIDKSGEYIAFTNGIDQSARILRIEE